MNHGPLHHGPVSIRPLVRWLAATVLCLAATFVYPLAAPVAAQQATQFFPQTGFAVSGQFLSYWQQNGGLSIFGYPISDVQPYTDPTTGQTVQAQWFERARFELHPENPPQYQVLLGLLGREVTADRQNEPPFQPAPAPPDATTPFFTQTGHAIASTFAGFWQANGGLPQFGYPISSAFQEQNPSDGQTYTVQYFERARFEYHPANDPQFQIELGLLGVQAYRRDVAARNPQITITAGNTQTTIGPNQTALLPPATRNLTVGIVYPQPVNQQDFQVQLAQLSSQPGWQIVPSGRNAPTMNSYSFGLRGDVNSPLYLRVEVIQGVNNPTLFFGLQVSNALPGKPALAADWSAAGLVPSYYNAITRGEYERAYSYWENPGAPNAAPASFEDFVNGYSNTGSVQVTTGALTSDAGAGNVYVAVPVVLNVALLNLQNGQSSQMFYGCYTLHQINAPVGDTVPPYPIAISAANIIAAPANADPAALLTQANALAANGQCGR